MGKRRLDMLLLERGLFDSREKARVAVMAGSVLVNDRPAVKPASLVDERSSLRLVERVSNSGLRTVLEDCLLDVMYEIPSRGDVKKCIVDANASPRTP